MCASYSLRCHIDISEVSSLVLTFAMVSSWVVVVCAPWHAVSSLAKSLLSKYTTLQLKYVQKKRAFPQFQTNENHRERSQSILYHGYQNRILPLEPPFLVNIG